jgi:hypothetical protein
MTYNKLKDYLFIDKLAVFMIICIAFVTLYNFNGIPWDTNRFLQAFMYEQSQFQSHESTIKNNIDVFTTSPLRNTSEINSDARQVGIATFMTPTIFSQVYEFLAHHPSWILNSALTGLVSSGRFNSVFVGVLIATILYRKEKDAFKHLNSKSIIMKQIFTACCYVLALMLLVSVLGLIIGHIRYNLQMRGLEETQILFNLYETEGLWKPNLLYYAQAMIGVFICLFSYTVFGVFAGHLFKDCILALLSLFLISIYFSYLLTQYPVTPLYFIPRVIGFFMMTVPNFFAIADGGILWNMLLLVVYLAITVLISERIIHLRLKAIK